MHKVHDPHAHMSWLARLLPYCDQEALWQATLRAYRAEQFFRRNPPHTGLATFVPLFVCPVDVLAGSVKSYPRFSVAFTSYLGVEGTDQWTKDGLLFLDSHVRLSDCSDGLATTILAGERPPSR